MPGDFREYFDLRKIDEQTMGQIEFVLNSPAYEAAFKPYIQNCIISLNKLWKDRSAARRAQYNDDFLAGGATFAEGLLKFFALLVEETSMERIHAAMADVPPEDMYNEKRGAGQMKPVVGLDQPALPMEEIPAEDY